MSVTDVSARIRQLQTQLSMLSSGGVGAVGFAPSFGGVGAFPSAPFGGAGTVACAPASGSAVQPGAVAGPPSGGAGTVAVSPSAGAGAGVVAPVGAPVGVPCAGEVVAAFAVAMPNPPSTRTAAAAVPMPTRRRSAPRRRVGVVVESSRSSCMVVTVRLSERIRVIRRCRRRSSPNLKHA